MEKRGQSAVVTTVLLILLTIAAMVIIIGFVIPFVNDQLNSGNCLDVAGKVDLGSTYTCYDDTEGVMRVQIHIQDIGSLIKGFVVELGGATSDSISITQESFTLGDFEMYQGSTFSLPGNNGARTYNITFAEKPEIIKVYPILNEGNRVCEESDSIFEIEDCL